jgi:hypothetical protein
MSTWASDWGQDQTKRLEFTLTLAGRCSWIRPGTFGEDGNCKNICDGPEPNCSKWLHFTAVYAVTALSFYHFPIFRVSQVQGMPLTLDR